MSELKSIYQIYEDMFGETFDILGLYWDNSEKQTKLILQCIEEEKIVWDILTIDELESIEEIKKGNAVF